MRLSLPSWGKPSSRATPPALSDSAGQESGPNAGELANPASSAPKRLPGETVRLTDKLKTELSSLVSSRFELAEKARRHREGEWAMALAYFDNKQWVEWHPEKGLQDIRDAADKRWYRTANLIRPLCQIATARITSNRPDVQILPRSSDRELDTQAAQELRLVVEHVNTKNHFRLTFQKLMTYAWMATTAFLLQEWDPEAEAEVAVEWDEENTPTRYELRRVGNYKERFVPGHEVYADPRASDWRQCEWVFHAQRMTNEDIERKWGYVAGASDGAKKTNFISLIESFVSPWSDSSSDSRHPLVLTMYEQPSVRYPDGRMVVSVGSEIVEYRKGLPCGMVPLLPVGCSQSLDGTAYHSAVGGDLLGPQYDYNLLRSRALGGLREQKLTIVRQKGDMAGADLTDDIASSSFGIDESPRVREIWYKNGRNKPEFTLPQMVDLGAVQSFAASLRQEMQEISGVHRVSSGAGDPNATSGISIRLLKDADESSGSEMAHEAEVFLEERARRMGIIVSKYVEEKRAWDLDDKSNAEEKKLVYSGLEALKAGGLASVRVFEGSATPRTPEAEDQQIIDMMQAGLLGDPASPEVGDLVLSLLHSPLAMRAVEAKKKSKQAALERQALEAQIAEQVDGIEAQGGMAAPEMPQMPPTGMPPEMPSELGLNEIQQPGL